MNDGHDLTGLDLAILATDGVEQVELTRPMKAFEEAGATVDLISPQASFRGFNHDLDPADLFEADHKVGEADPERYAALILPGGVANPDQLRIDPEAVAFVRAFIEAGKLVAATCHAPWLLIEANGVNDRRVTSYPSVRTDLENAGARWVDEPVVVDDASGPLLTSRGPDDIEAFSDSIIEVLSRGS